MAQHLLIFSFGLWKLRAEIEALTGLLPRYAPFGIGARGDFAAVAGWGHKPTAHRARRFAAASGKPYIAFEDGFLRSLRAGAETPPLSLVLDRSGIYYDAREASDIETMLSTAEFTAEECATAAELIATLRRERLSKYNDTPLQETEPIFRGSARRVAIIDQTFADASIEGGLATAQTFIDMIEAARSENPGADIVVKVHPDTMSGRKRGYLHDHAAALSLRILDRPLNPWALIEEIDHVYTVSSQFGLEALMANRKVTCFGMPFYAGWGLTDDRLAVERRARRRSIEEIVAASYLRYANYFDPWTRKPTDAPAALDALKFLRDRFLANSRPVVFYRIARWKRRPLATLLGGPVGSPAFTTSLRDAMKRAKQRSGAIAAWGRGANLISATPRSSDVPILSIEDGFIRSSGLGAAFAPSLSFTIDETGIYYDPTRPSDLEILLSTIELTPELRTRAQALRERIIASGLTKYNLATPAKPLDIPRDRDVVLVPGQAIDDEAVRLAVPPDYFKRDPTFGGVNLSLLDRARERHPHAFIIYKPHPDVERLGRLGRIPRAEAMKLADLVAADTPILALLGIAQRVETLTSLAGFEALLRGLKVSVHGRPFYSGWGLTEDINPPPRRGRKLDLDELIAGALILYPRYYDPASRLACPIEIALARIAEYQNASPVRRLFGETAGRLVIAARKWSR